MRAASDACATQHQPDRSAESGRGERLDWRMATKEDSPVACARATMTQVGSQCRPHIARERQAALAPTLTAQDDLAHAPVEILECECGDFTDPEPETDQ